MDIRTGILVLVCLWLGVGAPAQAQVDIDPFIRKDKFHDIKLSPKGDYFAATVPMEDKTALAIMSRADNKLTASFVLGKNTHVEDFWWVNPERVLIAISERYGQLDEPQLTGELYAINADGGKADLLVGYRVQGRGLGTRIQPKKVEAVAAFLVDTLPADDRYVIISVWPFAEDPFSRAEKLDVYTGNRVPVARAPVRRAEFTTDASGEVRFASGAGSDNVRKLYYREGSGADWRLINDQSVSGNVEVASGFSADGRTAYLLAEQAGGADAMVAYDTANGSRRLLLQDRVDTDGIIYQDGVMGSDADSSSGRVPVGVRYMDVKPRTAFFDRNAPEARVYDALQQAFAGQAVAVTSITQDGKTALVLASSDRNPGDFYLFDLEKKKAEYLMSRRDWFDPELMAEARPIALKARDGLALHGYLTLPKKGPRTQLPMVVLPHGGPFGVRDNWAFDTEAQLLAAAGYAVLQINFRGSGGYGRDFEHAGARQWGLAMQDDITDATRWAIEEHVADPARICIYGASYGAYAALMGVAKEPGLYRCAAGYVGAYHLPMMHALGDVQQRGSGETYLKEWIGEKSELAPVSPTNLASRIKVPVFLAAGGEDKRTPIEHSRMMERSLAAAGVPVETLYYPTEGHGFYTEPHRREYYTRLLDFLGRHIGGAKAKSD